MFWIVFLLFVPLISGIALGVGLSGYLSGTFSNRRVSFIYFSGGYAAVISFILLIRYY